MQINVIKYWAGQYNGICIWFKSFFFKRDKNPLGHKALPSSRICKSFVVQQFTATMLFQPAFKYTV